jgi:hypothetical protein
MQILHLSINNATCCHGYANTRTTCITKELPEFIIQLTPSHKHEKRNVLSFIISFDILLNVIYLNQNVPAKIVPFDFIRFFNQRV